MNEPKVQQRVILVVSMVFVGPHSSDISNVFHIVIDPMEFA